MNTMPFPAKSKGTTSRRTADSRTGNVATIALLAALGACLAVGVHANATARGIKLTKLELLIEGDINVTAVWGTGDLAEDKPLGFTAIRVKFDVATLDPISAEELDALLQHAKKWSPVANTMMRPVALDCALL